MGRITDLPVRMAVKTPIKVVGFLIAEARPNEEPVPHMHRPGLKSNGLRLAFLVKK